MELNVFLYRRCPPQLSGKFVCRILERIGYLSSSSVSGSLQLSRHFEHLRTVSRPPISMVSEENALCGRQLWQGSIATPEPSSVLGGLPRWFRARSGHWTVMNQCNTKRLAGFSGGERQRIRLLHVHQRAKRWVSPGCATSSADGSHGYLAPKNVKFLSPSRLRIQDAYSRC